MGTLIMFAFTPIANSSKVTESNEKENKPVTPHWEPLCDILSLNDKQDEYLFSDEKIDWKQHEYLFSDEKIDWNSAREMCELLGGYLVRIDNRYENNCILNYTQNNELHAWWWTSGTTY